MKRCIFIVFFVLCLLGGIFLNYRDFYGIRFSYDKDMEVRYEKFYKNETSVLFKMLHELKGSDVLKKCICADSICDYYRNMFFEYCGEIEKTQYKYDIIDDFVFKVTKLFYEERCNVGIDSVSLDKMEHEFKAGEIINKNPGQCEDAFFKKTALLNLDVTYLLYKNSFGKEKKLYAKDMARTAMLYFILLKDKKISPYKEYDKKICSIFREPILEKNGYLYESIINPYKYEDKESNMMLSWAVPEGYENMSAIEYKRLTRELIKWILGNEAEKKEIEVVI